MNPKWRGKPLAVVPMLADTTSCIAASIEAKKFGIRTGTSVADAKKICPGIILVDGNHEHYVEYHEKIVAAVESCLPVTSVMSIDEMACRLTGRDQKEENALALAQEIKKKIYQVGEVLSCSIGIAPNRFLAKVASDMIKPDGLVMIRKEELPDRLRPLPLRSLPGVGERTEQKLNRQGILNMPQLLALTKNEMAKVWGGVWGERIYDWVRGVDLELEEHTRRSISQSHVLPPDLRHEQGSWAVAQKLLQKAGTRMRKMSFWARRLSVSVRFIDTLTPQLLAAPRVHSRLRLSRSGKGWYWESDLKMLECQDPLTLQEVLAAVWREKPKGAPIQVAIALYDLITTHERNFSFFENPKRQALGKAVDKLNEKYGKGTIYFASLHDVKSVAPTRIAFTNIPKD